VLGGSSVNSFRERPLLTPTPNRNGLPGMAGDPIFPARSRRRAACGASALVRRPPSSLARRTPAAEAARRVVERLDLFPVDVLHALDHQLGDAIARVHAERLMRVG